MRYISFFISAAELLTVGDNTAASLGLVESSAAKS